jgi:hypothetical protein
VVRSTAWNCLAGLDGGVCVWDLRSSPRTPLLNMAVEEAGTIIQKVPACLVSWPATRPSVFDSILRLLQNAAAGGPVRGAQRVR